MIKRVLKEPSFFDITLFKDVPIHLLREYADKFLDDKIEFHKQLIDLIKQDECDKPKKQQQPKISKKRNEISLLKIGYNSAFPETKSFQRNDEPKIFERRRCDCLAQKHELINNCLNCGRIVCSVEGSGACFTCNSTVTKTPNFEKPKINENFCALKNRNKLLEQQRNKKENTKVYDDQDDYFSYENQWISVDQRKELKNLERAVANKDFLEINLKTLDVKTVSINENDERIKQIKNEILNEENPSKHLNIYDEYRKNKDHFQPKFNINSEFIPISSYDNASNYFDTSMCVTIDQPWASWSVNGNISLIPISQFFDYRGSIWIISSAKKTDLPLKDFIYNKIEKYFIKSDKLNKKMKCFPSSVVLGKASITDCVLYSFNDQTKEFNQLTQYPYFLLIDSSVCFKNPLPIKPVPGMWKIPPFVQSLLENLESKNN